ncbi:hypothetical protein Q1695_015613 [Nippostrongylus brasiliensis]|nr:hypothetical protein Q1695_015613 [Nippostrongylus brasiliensis]
MAFEPLLATLVTFVRNVMPESIHTPAIFRKLARAVIRADISPSKTSKRVREQVAGDAARGAVEAAKVMSEPQTKDLKFEDSDSGHNDGRRTLSEVEAISEKTELEETEQEHTEEEEA